MTDKRGLRLKRVSDEEKTVFSRQSFFYVWKWIVHSLFAFFTVTSVYGRLKTAYLLDLTACFSLK